MKESPEARPAARKMPTITSLTFNCSRQVIRRISAAAQLRTLRRTQVHRRRLRQLQPQAPARVHRLLRLRLRHHRRHRIPLPSPPPTNVLISQAYGGGGNSTAPFRNDFIEIFNNGETAVNLAGWSVQYAGATATTWSVTNLSSVSLAPGHYYLVQESSGGSTGANLPTPDATGSIAMAATAGKIALIRHSAGHVRPQTATC